MGKVESTMRHGTKWYKLARCIYRLIIAFAECFGCLVCVRICVFDELQWGRFLGLQYICNDLNDLGHDLAKGIQRFAV